MTTVANLIRYGQLHEFDAENETVTAYLERAELYFDANDVADEKKVPLLLSIIGAKTYGLLRSLVAPKAPKEKTFAEVKTLLKNHFEPVPSVIAEHAGARREYSIVRGRTQTAYCSLQVRGHDGFPRRVPT